MFHLPVLSARQTLRNSRGILKRTFFKSTSLNMPIKVGDKLPSIDVHEGTPGDVVNVAELFKGKKGVLFAVPGAFTPGCSKTHLPGYVSDFDKIKAKGVEVIACLSVNDAFVMSAWGEQQKADGKVRMLADTKGDFTKAIEMDFDATPFLGNHRSKRYSMVVEDGTVTALNVEPDGKGLTCSLSNNILKQI
ncbi:peroxiredoxin-5, mitochondrial-like [Dendronephthya gigantea]|uniref:peroxiredoxin-5, mitochondrial-like n=1 Tax=Dendronephthya gigantea TaxID=151771 RepID=UPI00106D301E|nr:peroxiredoxin-5, mitochondrial-like [Dendronephthya gigantea]